MFIKQLCNTKEEYIAFATDLLNRKEHSVQEIWRAEDLPKLQPYFDWEDINRGEDRTPWTPEALASYKHYEKCRKEYADKLFEIRDSLENIPIESLLSSLYFKEKFDYRHQLEMEEKYPDDWEARMDAEGFPYIFDEEEFFHKFPVIVIGGMDSGFDRVGNFAVLDLHIVSKSDFDVVKPKI